MSGAMVRTTDLADGSYEEMPLAADLERALADVERIAKDLFETSIKEWSALNFLHDGSWKEALEHEREHMRRVVRSLLLRGVIKVGARPTVERPMEGQVTIDEALDLAVVNLSVADGRYEVETADFTLTYHDCPPSQNDEASGYKAPHWSVGAKVKKEWQSTFESLLMVARVPRDGSTARIEAVASLRFPVIRERDEGNYKMVLDKALGDALQNGGWLPNDTPEWYRFRDVIFEPDLGPHRTVVGLFITTKETAHGSIGTDEG